MDIQHSAEDLAFREEVRAFLDGNLPEHRRHTFNRLDTATKESTLWWQGVLGEKGWFTRSWPKEHGGTQWSLMQHHIFNAECTRYGAPNVSGFGVIMVGPVIYTFGTEDQKQKYLPGIQDGTTLWCQGYSEPGSGSDLASLQTSAVRDGDHYVVNGQKIWTSYAHWADKIFCLVRTDSSGKKQEGITFLLIDMDTPGVTTKPIISIDNEHHLNEVFFTDVRVPVENRVGEENKGWTYAKFLLGNERTATGSTAGIRGALDTLKHLAKIRPDGSPAPIEDPAFAMKVAELESKLIANQHTELRSLDAADGSFDAVKLSLPLKLMGTELKQRVDELLLELVGYGAFPTSAGFSPLSNEETAFDKGPDAMSGYLFNRASTIYGGTTEVQKNIMSKMILGL